MVFKLKLFFLIAFLSLMSAVAASAQANIQALSYGLNVVATNFTPPLTGSSSFFFSLPPASTSFSMIITPHTTSSPTVTTTLSTLNFNQLTTVASNPNSTGPQLTCITQPNGGIGISAVINSLAQAVNSPQSYVMTCPVPVTFLLYFNIIANPTAATDIFILVNQNASGTALPTIIGGENQNGTQYAFQCVDVISPAQVCVPVMLQLQTVVDGLGASAGAFENGNNQTPVPLQSLPYAFNGVSLDPNFKCNTAVAISVAAAGTQQLSAPTAGKKARVCAMFLSVSTAGTLSFTEGTGATCGTGTTTIGGPMTLPVGMSPIIAGGSPGALITNVSGDGFCLVSGTAAVQGWAQVATPY